MFAQWLALPAWVILLSLVLVYGLSGLVLYRISFGSDGRPRMGSFSGIAPPFLGLPTLLFGLMAGFLASDVWDHSRQAARALLDERDAALTIESIDQAMPASRARLDSLVHAYVRAVLAEELLTDDDRGSPAVKAALEELIHEIALPEIASEAGSSVQSALLTAASRISGARSTRLALTGVGADELKWTTVACLAFLAQMGVAIVHLERNRAQIGSLVVFTGCAIAVMSLIAVCERPFRGSHETTAAPLIAVLPP